MTLDLPRSFETERGSAYTYLADGRVQRHKYTGESRPPHDITVFLPDFETLTRVVPSELLNRMEINGNSDDYDHALTHCVYGGEYGFHVISRDGRILKTPDALAATTDGLFLTFEKGGKVEFYIPVSRTPRRGWSVFQTTKENGERRTHLGHKVTKINP